MGNPDVQITLREAVGDILLLTTGLSLEYDPSQDRFHSIARLLNKALRQVAIEHEWSFYSDVEDFGVVQQNQREVILSSRQRIRIVQDDAVRLVNEHGDPVVWAYMLPRDALHKYRNMPDLRCAVTRSTITFSKPLSAYAGLRIQVPVMREPRMFDIPPIGEQVDEAVLDQLLDFDWPDLVVARAAYLMAQSDPVLQPRVQTLEAQYKDIMYQLIERDDRFTDSPYQNEYTVPIQSSLNGSSFVPGAHGHPHSDSRWM